MLTTTFSKERFSQEEEVRALRKEQLRYLMCDLSALVINTGNKNKALALANLINSLTGQKLVSREIICFADPNQEALEARAAAVARSKVKNLIEDLNSCPEHCHTIDGTPGSEDLDLLLSQLALFAGSDVNSFIQEEDGSWFQNHQLARHYSESLPEEKFWQLRERLRKQFCFPKNNKVVVRWDIASYLVNGQDHSFSDLIEVTSQAVDPDLLDMYLFAAIDNGLILESNQHFAALECLIENGKIISTSHLPRELEEGGANLADFASFDVSPVVLSAFLYSVVNNTPIYIP
jgi:hypothetical protein